MESRRNFTTRLLDAVARKAAAMKLIEDLCAALLLFFALCCAGIWLISRDGAQGPVMVVENGRE